MKDSKPPNGPTSELKNENEEKDRQEGLKLLLGGLDLDDKDFAAGNVQWDDDDDDDKNDEVGNDKANQSQQQTKDKKEATTMAVAPTPDTLPNNDTSNNHHNDYIFGSAHALDAAGKLLRPPVRLDATASRGNRLISTQTIPKGSVVFTERAAVATQLTLPARRKKTKNGKNGNNSADTDDNTDSNTLAVRACQNCFCSMAPASAAVAQHSASLSLPYADLYWPIPEYDCHHENNDTADETTTIQMDQHGRVHCTRSEFWFCHQHCWRQFQQQVGDPATLRKALELILLDENDDGNDDTAHRETNHDYYQQTNNHHKAALALAVRMFAMAVTHYRRHQNLNNCFWKGLCGSTQDLNELQLGRRIKDNDPNAPAVRYTLQPLYTQLVKLYQLTKQEQDAHAHALSLHLLETFAAMAARNGFDLQTQSPFATYYQALQRNHGGRPLKASLQQQVARAISGQQQQRTNDNGNDSDDTKQKSNGLERGMDRTVNQRVTPDICAIFPLTARINHSCAFPNNNTNTISNTNSSNDFVNAQLMSQVFVDCHADLVAVSDIHPGQEILISYLGGGNGGLGGGRHKSVHRRKEELKNKYLFECSCPSCVKEGTLLFG